MSETIEFGLSPSSRDFFEDYFHATRRKGRELDFTQHADGTYIHDHVQRHWLTWQVARGERDYSSRRRG